MRTHRRTRFLSMLMALLMLVTLMPMTAFAADTTSTWEPVALADITAGDTVAITMTKDGTTWALPTAKTTTTGPAAAVAAVADGKLTISAAAADYGWTITASGGTYQISGAGGQLYVTATNNGVRVGTPEDTTGGVFSLTDGYLTATDSKGDVRYVGVYTTNPDWRCYALKNGAIANNIAGQTLGFWKLAESTTPGPAETTEPTELPESILLTKLDAAPKDGDTVIIYHPKSHNALTATASGKKLAGVEAAVETEDLFLGETMAQLKVSVAEDVYTFALEDGKVLTSAAAGGGLSFDDPVTGDGADLAKWTLEQQTDGTWYLMNVGAVYNEQHNQALEYYSGFTTYGVKADNDDYKFDFYAQINKDPVSGLKSGDVVAIYNDANAKALTATASGTKLAGADAALNADGKLPAEGIAALTVTVDDDGYVLFENNGKVLTSGATGNGLSFADEANEFSLWVIEDAGNGLFFLKNANAVYTNSSGAKPQYLEFYNTFTTYSKNSDAPYAMSFRQLADSAEPSPEPTTEPSVEPSAEPTIVPPAALQAELVTDLSTLKAGDQVVVFNPSSGKAMSETDVATFYRAGVDASVSNGKLTGFDETAVWTLGVNAENETYTFTSATGRVLTAGTRNSLPMGDENPDWTLVAAATEDCVYVRNAGRDTQYVEWYTDKNEFSAYKYVEANEAIYAMQIFRVVPPVQEGFITDLAELQDGDTILVYNPANGKVMSETDVASFYRAGEDVTAADGKLSGYSESAVWTVGVNTADDGSVTYTFTSATGRVLTAGTRNSLPMDDANPDWNILPAATEGCVYIQNAARNTQYVEWYTDKNEFSAYKYVEANEAIYAMQLYRVVKSDVTPDPGGDTAIASLDELTAGMTVLIYNVGHETAASSKPNGDWYLKAEPTKIVDGKPESFTADLVWTVGVEDGVYTFSNGENIMTGWLSENNGKQYAEVSVDGSKYPDTGWNVSVADAANRTFYIKNATVTGSYGPFYLEGFTKNDAEVFSGYFTEKINDDNYRMKFYPVDPADASEGQGIEHDGVLQPGDKVVVYNAEAGGAMGMDNTGLNNSLANIPTEIRGGSAYPQNGAYAFNVGVEQGYYTFAVGGKYLTANNAEDLFLQEEMTEASKWYLKANGAGYTIFNKDASYNGNPVCIEFFSGSFSGWTFKSADAKIFAMQFYPLADGITTLDDAVNVPKVVFTSEESVVKQDVYKAAFTIDDLTPAEQIASVVAEVNGEQVQALSNEGKNYTFTVPAEVTAEAEALALKVTVTYVDGKSYDGEFTVAVRDEPMFLDLQPAPNSETLDDKTPVISATVKNVTDDAAVEMLINGEAVEAVLADGVVSWQASEPMQDGRVTVKLTVTRPDGVSGEKSWSFHVGVAREQLYFGQLHSHTTYSDGSGSLETALDYVKNLPESANIQFVAFTDHSNYFDSTSEANPEGALYDMSLAGQSSRDLWNAYRKSAADFNASQSDVIALAGFEMTWSGGPGHINTFNSPGIVSRNNSTLNNKSNDAGMKAYYALLDQEEGVETLSQFNHPGKTFGTFSDFSYWDAVTDSRMFMVEVGNGEGQIGAGGYYPSYEQYIVALDKGWHLAPTNNQDNHKGRWGNANDARDVVLTDDFSEQGIYAAIRAMRMYATEDKNLEVYYNVNGQPLGSTITEVPEQLELNVSISDPDAKDRIEKVEVVVNSGKVIHTWSDVSELTSGSLSVTLAPDYSYYFIRVTEGDGDLAVTAPVWVGDTLKLGISALTCGTAMPVTGEKLTLTTTIFNSEASPATVKSVTYTTSGGVVIEPDPEPGTTASAVPANSTLDIPFTFTPDKAKVMKITVTVVLEQDGKEFTFTKDIELDVQNADELVYIGIDASHYNEYVAGNYKDSMGNFAALASDYAVRTVELKTSEELIAACSNPKYKLLIFTAPSRRLDAAQSDPRTYSAEEIAAIKAFNEAGGLVVVSGWGDAYENYSAITGNADIKHMAETQNELLAALGSSIRLGDDEVVDDELNGGQSQRVYFDAYNFDHYLMEGVIVDPDHPNDRDYSEVYSNYGGCSVFFEGSGVPATVTPVVFGHATTNIANKDNDSNPQGVKYPYADGDDRVVVMATEQLDGKGEIIVSGAAFMSNFEVQAAASSGASDADQQKNYSNYKICENLVSPLNAAKVSPIAEVRAQTEDGYKFVIEGTVTSNASGYDKDTAFFDCIYVQDETAGICCFPVAGNFKLGDKVRVTGYTDFYQGEPELQVTQITLLGEGESPAPTEVPAGAINDRSAEGMLVTVKGVVEEFQLENGLIQTIMVKDAKGDVARVFIDGYITTAEDVKDCVVGAEISATGLASYDDTFNAPFGPFPRIRVRDRADIVCTAPAELRIVEQPASAEAAYGETASFTVVAEGDGVTYQWYYQKPGTSKWYPSSMEGADTATLLVPMTETRDGQTYRCKVSDVHGATLTSDAAVLTAAPLTTELKITEQPVGASAPLGETVLLSVAAEGEGLRYRWQFRAQGVETWYDSTADGAKTDTLEIELTEIRNGQQYRCIVSDVSGASVTSDAAAIHVEGSVNILEHPRSASGDEGDIVMMSVIAEGDGLSYQWQFKRAGWDKWYNSTQDGAKTDTLVVPVIESRNGQMYRCVVRDANGGREISEIAVITLRGHVTITTQPQNVSAAPGDNVTMTVVVEGDVMAYQWQYQPAGKTGWFNSGMTGSDTAELQIPAEIDRNGQKYRCMITEPTGAITYSDAATLTVRDANAMP